MMNSFYHPESNQVAGSGLELNNEGKALTVSNNILPEPVPNQFSVFSPGYINRKGDAVLSTKSLRITSIIGVYRFITGTYAVDATNRLRLLFNKEEASRFKKLNFYVATFSGIFRYRRASEIVQHSQLLVLDFDEPDIRAAWPNMDIEDALQHLRSLLLSDTVFETELLFRSPSGKGLKWVICVGDMEGMKHKDYFRCVSNYLLNTYHVHVDESGKDVCRACFLPHDPECFINQNLLNNEETNY